MKKINILISIGLMITSWSVGIYFLNSYYDTVLIVPTINDYFWTSPFKGILGLTTILTAIALIFYFFQPKLKLFLRNQKYFIMTKICNNIIWIAVVAIQVKVIAFNLGICH